MSVFASKTLSDPMPFPSDAAQSYVVRKLTAREYQQVQDEHRAEFISGHGRLWSKAFRRMLEHGAKDDEAKRLLADPLNGFDRYAVVRCGLVSWTLPERIEIREDAAHTDADMKQRQAYIDDLGDDDIEAMARDVLRLTKPSLFESAEVLQKNG